MNPSIQFTIRATTLMHTKDASGRVEKKRGDRNIETIRRINRFYIMAPISIVDLTSYEAIIGLVNVIFSGKNEANGYIERAEEVLIENKLKTDPIDKLTAICSGSKDETYKVNLQITDVQDGKKPWQCNCPAMRGKPNAICKHCIAFLLHRINYIPSPKPTKSKKLSKPKQQTKTTDAQQQAAPPPPPPPPAAAGTAKRRLPSSFYSPYPLKNKNKTNINNNTTTTKSPFDQPSASQKRKINQQTDNSKTTIAAAKSKPQKPTLPTKSNVAYKPMSATKMLAIADDYLVELCRAEVDKIKESIININNTSRAKNQLLTMNDDNEKQQQQQQQQPPPPPPAAPLFSFDAIFKKSATTTTSAPVAPSILASVQPVVSNQTLPKDGSNNINSIPIPAEGGEQEEGEDSKPKSLREKMALISGKR